MQDVLRQPRDTGSNSSETEYMKAFNLPSYSVRVGVSTDGAEIADRLRGHLRRAEGIELVELGQSEHPPAVLLLECNAFSPHERLRLQRAVRRHHPARVLWVVSEVPAANDAVLEGVNFGWCHGYVARNAPGETILRAIMAVAGHELWLPRGLVAQALTDLQKFRSALGQPAPVNGSGHSRSLLTARERQILQFVRAGLTNKEVGRHLGIEEDTVKKHLRNMYAKLGVRRRAQMLTTIAREARTSGSAALPRSAGAAAPATG